MSITSATRRSASELSREIKARRKSSKTKSTDVESTSVFTGFKFCKSGIDLKALLFACLTVHEFETPTGTITIPTNVAGITNDQAMGFIIASGIGPETARRISGLCMTHMAMVGACHIPGCGDNMFIPMPLPWMRLSMELLYSGQNGGCFHFTSKKPGFSNV